jgi:hypothetical protein
MAMEWLEKFIDKLAGLLKEPPYRQFAFIGAVFVVVSLILQRGYDQTWMFLIYSVAGTMWRYMERDVRHNVLPKKCEKISIVIYHIGNIGLFFGLLYYLGFI